MLARAITARRRADSAVLRLFGFGDDGGLRNAGAHQVFAAYAALGVLVAAISAQGNDQRRDAAVVEGNGMVEAGAETGEGCRRTRPRRKRRSRRREPAWSRPA